MKMARAGEMRHRVIVEEKTIVQDPSTGVQSEEWSDKFPTITAQYGGIPAAVRSLTSRELEAANARQSESTVEFEMMFGLDITGEDRIVFENSNWDLEPPTFDERRQRRMKIKAARGPSNG